MRVYPVLVAPAWLLVLTAPPSYAFSTSSAVSTREKIVAIRPNYRVPRKRKETILFKTDGFQVSDEQKKFSDELQKSRLRRLMASSSSAIRQTNLMLRSVARNLLGRLSKFTVAIPETRVRHFCYKLPRRILLLVFFVWLSTATVLVGSIRPVAQAATTTSSVGLLKQAFPTRRSLTQSEKASYQVESSIAPTPSLSSSLISHITKTTLSARSKATLSARSLLESSARTKTLFVSGSILMALATTGTFVVVKTAQSTSLASSGGFKVVNTTDISLASVDMSPLQLDFEKIRMLRVAQEDKLRKARSLLNGITEKFNKTTEAFSVSLLNATTTSVNASDKTVFVAKQRRDEGAAQILAEFLNQVERVQESAVDLMLQRQDLEVDMNDFGTDGDNVDINLPPPVEETEFADWLTANDDYEAARAALQENDLYRALSALEIDAAMQKAAYEANSELKERGLYFAWSAWERKAAKESPAYEAARATAAANGRTTAETMYEVELRKKRTALAPPLLTPFRRAMDKLGLPPMNRARSLPRNFSSYPPYLGYFIPPKPNKTAIVSNTQPTD